MGVFFNFNMEIRYWALLILLGAVWGSAFIFIKVAAPEFGAVALVQARLVIASLIFVPLLLRKKYLLLPIKMNVSISVLIIINIFF